MTRVVNLRQEAHQVYIGRGGRGQSGYFGNPFKVKDHGEAKALELYRAYFLDRVERDERFRERILELNGKVLGCFCKPGPCHGDVIAEWLESQPKGEA